MIMSIESLERMASDVKPPLVLKDIRKRADDMYYATEGDRPAAREAFADMRAVYMSGRGDVSQWTPEVLDDIDECFVKHFMEDGEPIPSLFYPHDEGALLRYGEYVTAVETVMDKHSTTLPRYAKEYMSYYLAFDRDVTPFPIPVGTASVILCLHKLADRVRKGFIEVSLWHSKERHVRRVRAYIGRVTRTPHARCDSYQNPTSFLVSRFSFLVSRFSFLVSRFSFLYP
jgi:hypothetical protein